MTNSIIKTTLYAASVLPLKDAKLYRLAYNTASAERRQKVDKYRFEKDRCLSLGADMLMRYVLRKENVAHDYLRINLCRRFPYFVHPLHPKHLLFSFEQFRNTFLFGKFFYEPAMK